MNFFSITIDSCNTPSAHSFLLTGIYGVITVIAWMTFVWRTPTAIGMVASTLAQP